MNELKLFQHYLSQFDINVNLFILTTKNNPWEKSFAFVTCDSL